MESSARNQNMGPKISDKIIKCFKYYFIFHKSLPFIFVLISVHAWVEYALVAILITHLTDGLLHLPKAASIVNVQDGTTAFLVLVVAYLSDAYLGAFKSLVWTSLAYTTHCA
ncbi:hypothetical protein C2S53_005052 [Perilla frutescens var. hirtella]|uniref:Uncharacterized protein n=1 Tax=Perilla frutescens var. hirtella TaxID=608512 RepID=A0AAD4J9Z2_PERFH|nr:hypothetical protein C2S53_005052 [Perilla frutescens var. hirtella]